MHTSTPDSFSELQLLDRVLGSTSLASDVFFAGEPCGDWRMYTSGSDKVAFHLVLHGSPWIHWPDVGASSHQLHRGDFVFFPRDAPHVLSNSAERPPQADTSVESVEPVGSSEDRTALICGKIKVELHVQRFLLAALPEMVLMPARGAGVGSIVPALVSILWEEVRGQTQPLSVTLNKLADVLVAQVLRFAVTAGLLSSGLFAALADPQLRRATLELIRTPEHPWSVESLAQRALMSRSAFAARFQAVVGRTPLDLLREWRMQVAVGLLRSGHTVADVAIATGYDTEAAFAKAFKRAIGMGPGALRRSSQLA